MCGRYALGIRAAFVRHQLQQHHMPVDEAPEDDEVRETYNFAPGYHGLVYRADVPDHGADPRHHVENGEQESGHIVEDGAVLVEKSKEIRYKLQAMKWGLVPFWTKRNPDYGTVMKTINARDDSLIENRGMWNTMKQKKRCIIVAQGFYEWLKKNGGKEKIPHFVKRKDGQLMCFAGLWDCVRYEGSDEKLYTYTIITTDSNKQLKFLHDRMPAILENGSDEILTWLDPGRSEWNKELQSLLRPFDGELECYAVSKDVGKVGNNSPDFIIPVASSENKNNIANFFSNASKVSVNRGKQDTVRKDPAVKLGEDDNSHDENEDRVTVDELRSEDNAPMPIPDPKFETSGLKRDREDDEEEAKPPAKKTLMREYLPSKSPEKRQTRSATSNGTMPKGSPSKASRGTPRITNFFSK